MFRITSRLFLSIYKPLLLQHVYKEVPPPSLLYRTMPSQIQVANIKVNEPDKVKYDELISLIGIKSVYLIDVREDNELKETGILPNSINIPVGNIESALKLPNDEFEVKYGIKKPDFDTPIIFSCRSGKRSLKAYDTAIALGFKKVLNYEGGWLDWEKKR